MADDKELDIEVVDDEVYLYPACVDVTEQRRAFILERMGSAEFDGAILLANMKQVEAWLKTGEIVTTKPEGKIRAVK